MAVKWVSRAGACSVIKINIYRSHLILEGGNFPYKCPWDQLYSEIW